MSAKLFDSDPEMDAMSSDDLLALVTDEHEQQGRRGRAMSSVARRGAEDPSLIPEIVAAIKDDRQRGTVVIGTSTLSHLGIGGLFAGASAESRAAAGDLVREWPEGYDKDDLMWLLRSAGVLPHDDGNHA